MLYIIALCYIVIWDVRLYRSLFHLSFLHIALTIHTPYLSVFGLSHLLLNLKITTQLKLLKVTNVNLLRFLAKIQQRNCERSIEYTSDDIMKTSFKNFYILTTWSERAP